jgi:hypothetical protein
MNVRSEISVLIVAIIFGVLTGVVYTLVTPAFFTVYDSGWVLDLGVLVATLIGGYIGYHVPTATKFLVRILLGICYASVMAILVLFLSLSIIVNTRGS